jgi:hypothetical protein
VVVWKWGDKDVWCSWVAVMQMLFSHVVDVTGGRVNAQGVTVTGGTGVLGMIFG